MKTFLWLLPIFAVACMLVGTPSAQTAEASPPAATETVPMPPAVETTPFETPPEEGRAALLQLEPPRAVR